MTQPWKHLEGQVIGGKFRLLKYLGGSDHSAVFLTERPEGEPRQAAIKFVAARPDKAARQLSRWAEAEKMSHPHLLRLFEMGQCRVGKENLLYLVMEHAEENLSQVVEARALSGRECLDMLPPVLDALAYLHRQGFVHGRLKPANILAAEERVKLSCDGLAVTGEASSEMGGPSVYDPPESAGEGLSPAGDVWSLGMTLVEVLTRKVPMLQAGRFEPALPPSIPTALLQVVRHSLRLPAKQRWTVAELAARVAPAAPRVEPGEGENRGRKNYLAAAVAAAIVAVIIVAGWTFSHRRVKSAAIPAPSPAKVAVHTVSSAEPAPAPSTKEAAPPAPAPQTSVHSAVLRQVVPKVPKSARDTISGTIRVGVRVSLAGDGSVARARLQSAGPSRYFARLALQAAQQWKFAPPQPQGPNTADAWLLHFQFRRNSTHVIPAPLAR